MSCKKLSIFLCVLVSFSFSQGTPVPAAPPASTPAPVQTKNSAAVTPTPKPSTTPPVQTKNSTVAAPAPKPPEAVSAPKQKAETKTEPEIKKKNEARGKNDSKTDAAALKRYEEKYNEMVQDRDNLISSESIEKNIKHFLDKLRKDLDKQEISGKVIVRDIAFDTSLVKDGSNLIVYKSVFFGKDNEGKDVVFIPNEYKNKLFYFVDDNGISIEKGVSKGASFIKVMKKEKVSYAVSFALRFVNQEFQMVVLVKDVKDEIVFSKTYTQAYKMYGVLKYHERNIRMGLGLDAGLGFLFAKEIDQKGPIFLALPNIFVGVFIPKVGVGGVQLDVAFFSSFDYFSFTGFFNLDFMEVARVQLPVHLLLETRLGFGFQFIDVNRASTFLMFGPGLRLDVYDTFFFRVGINFYVTKKANSRQFDNIASKNLIPPQVTFGGGFYIL